MGVRRDDVAAAGEKARFCDGGVDKEDIAGERKRESFWGNMFGLLCYVDEMGFCECVYVINQTNANVILLFRGQRANEMELFYPVF